MSHRHHGPLPPPPAPSRRRWPWIGAAIALAVLWTLGGCAPPSTDWLDRRDLAAVAHCPPPPLLGDADACAHLAWDRRR